MDYLDLLLADRIRERAGEFRRQARNRKRDEIARAGGDEDAEIAAWDVDTKSDEFLTMAYEELGVVSRFIAKLEEKKRKLPTIPESAAEAPPTARPAA